MTGTEPNPADNPSWSPIDTAPTPMQALTHRLLAATKDIILFFVYLLAGSLAGLITGTVAGAGIAWLFHWLDWWPGADHWWMISTYMLISISCWSLIGLLWGIYLGLLAFVNRLTGPNGVLRILMHDLLSWTQSGSPESKDAQSPETQSRLPGMDPREITGASYDAMVESWRKMETRNAGCNPLGWCRMLLAKLFIRPLVKEMKIAGGKHARELNGQRVVHMGHVHADLSAFCTGLTASYMLDMVVGIWVWIPTLCLVLVFLLLPISGWIWGW